MHLMPASDRPVAFRRTPATDEVIGRILGRADDDTPARRRVRCPHCQWQPGPHDRWYCAPSAEPPEHHRGCGSSWNTFETGGRCPGCGHAWQWTACLVCSAWSPHLDWYATDDE